MRLKKVFAGALAAAMLVCAVAVPAFAAEEVEQENGLSSSYVQMNIPYADFYKAAGVDNASEIDAVTSATKNKTRAGNLAAGSYHVNAFLLYARFSVIFILRSSAPASLSCYAS